MLHNPIFCAIDRAELEPALALGRSLLGVVGGLKLGLELFTSEGPNAVRAMARLGSPIFLDLKLHDIPNTVARATHAAGGLGAAYLTLHAAGGPAMLRAAADAAAGLPKPPTLLAITVLTSLDADDLKATGISLAPADQAVAMAKLAQSCGIGGIVCSPHEIGAIRAACGPKLKIVVPGIRPQGGEIGDQKRVMTPREALAVGADLLVIGRPITAAADPRRSALAITQSLGA